jgi:hypothetical protein
VRGFKGRVEPLRLLDLVRAVQDVAANDREVVAALQHLLDSRTDDEPPHARLVLGPGHQLNCGMTG